MKAIKHYIKESIINKDLLELDIYVDTESVRSMLSVIETDSSLFYNKSYGETAFICILMADVAVTPGKRFDGTMIYPMEIGTDSIISGSSTRTFYSNTTIRPATKEEADMWQKAEGPGDDPKYYRMTAKKTDEIIKNNHYVLLQGKIFGKKLYRPEMENMDE